MKRSTKENKKTLKESFEHPSTKEKIIGISIIVLIILFTFFSIDKLISHLNKPSVQFYSTVESIYNDLYKHKTNFNSIELFQILNSDGIEINSDIRVNSANLVGDLEGLKNILNSLNYSSNIRINRSTNYQSLKIKMVKDSIEKMNIDYLSSNNRNFIKATNVNNNNYIELDNENFYFNSFDLEMTSLIGELFKNKLLDLINDNKFEVSNNTTIINSKEFNCKKITYTFTGSEIQSLIDNILIEITNNEKLSLYLSKFLKTSEIVPKINSLLNVTPDNLYQISAFINNSNSEGIKLEIKDQNDHTMSYNKIDNYSSIDFTRDDITKSISITGSLTYKYMITIENGTSTIVISSSPNKNNKEGTITVLDNLGNKVFDCNFTYMISKQTSKLSSLSATLNFILYDQDNTGNLDINLSSLINSGVEINELSPTESTTLTEFEATFSTDLKTSIINCIRNINLNNPPTENLPSSFR